MANMQRVSLDAHEAAIEAELRYDRAMRGGHVIAGSPADRWIRRGLRASVVRAGIADQGAVKAVRALRRNVELSGDDGPREAA